MTTPATERNHQKDSCVRMSGFSLRFVLAIMAAAFAMLLIVFLLWQSGQPRPALNDAQIVEFLRDDNEPGVIQYALAQIQQRMQRREAVTQFYPELVRLASHRSEDVRHTVAHMLASDASRPEFRQALLNMLQQQSTLVRNAASLSLASFGDGAGRAQILNMLEPERITAPQAGRIKAVTAAGTNVGHGGVIAQLQDGSSTIDVRSPMTGRVLHIEVENGDEVSAGVQLAVVTPGPDQALAALRALERVGQAQDLAAISAYLAKGGAPEAVVEQAKVTEQAIRTRK